MNNYYEKYLKYKSKYLKKLGEQTGGAKKNKSKKNSLSSDKIKSILDGKEGEEIIKEYFNEFILSYYHNDKLDKNSIKKLNIKVVKDAILKYLNNNKVKNLLDSNKWSKNIIIKNIEKNI